MKVFRSLQFLAVLFVVLAASLTFIGISSVEASTCEPNTYYVDATNGLDTNDGTCSDKAWKTIAKVNSSSFSPGNTIKFKKGETWKERLTVPSSGTSGAPITFTSYGEGEKPIIDGDNTATYGIYSNDKSYVTIDGFIIKKLGKTLDATYAVYIIRGTDNIVENCDISEVYYATNPMLGGSATAWEGQRGYGIGVYNSSNVKILNNTVRDIGATAIHLSAGSGVQVIGGEIYNNEITNFNVGIRIALSNGTAGTGYKDVKIHGNYIHDFGNYYYCTNWHRDGIHIFARPDAMVLIENVEIYNNYFTDNAPSPSGGTAWIYIEYGCVNFNIHHNVMQSAPGYHSIRILGKLADFPIFPRNHIIAHNTMYCHPNSPMYGVGVDISRSPGIKMYNNIIDSDKNIYSIDGDSLSGFESNNNLVYDVSGGDSFVVNSVWYTFAELQALGYDTASIYGQATFEGSPAADAHDPMVFKLKNTSLGINTGKISGFGSDKDGVSIPQGIAPDIGAYEYVGAFVSDTTPPSAPANLVIQ